MEIDKLKPEVIPLLKRRRGKGMALLISSVFFAFGGILMTHETCSFEWAVFTFFGMLALGLAAIYCLSRSTVPEQDPHPVLSGCVIAFLLAVGGLILHYAWERFFSRRDDDAGLAVTVIGLEFILGAVFQALVLYNHRKGFYRRMLKTDETIK